MITPNEDKLEIKKILRKDSYIRRTKITEKDIKTTGASADVVNLSQITSQIFISMGKPEGGSSELVKNSTYDVMVTGSRDDSNKTDSIVSQIIALLEGRNIGNGHRLYLLNEPMELSSNPNIYIVEMTFLCQGTVFNRIKQ